MRTCSKCGEPKPGDAYYKNPDGRLRGDCKACICADRAAKYKGSPAMRERLTRRALRHYEDEVVRGPLVERNCSLCGAEMMRSRTGEPGVCIKCKSAMGYKVGVTREQRVAIYERDGWTCWLCDQAVDSVLEPNDRMAATLDHVLPRSLTLFIDDSPENLRLAHRACNSARGARAA